MPEVPGILNNAPASRSPAAATWKLLYTATQTAVLSVHVCNGTAADSGFRIAIIPASVGYVDGAAPPSYSIVCGGATLSRFLESTGEYDTATFNIGLNDVVAVYCDNVGVTFLCQGFLFS